LSKIFFISDIHFFNRIASSLYQELQESFIKELIQEKDEIDLVIIGGDLFHTKVSFDSESSRLTLKFINEILTTLKDKPLRILKGTRTHDYTMLDSLKFFQEEYDIEIINTACEENINGMKILYVPEEYPKDWKDYYEDCFNFKNNKPIYDIIFGHGSFDFASHLCQKIDSERNIQNSPVFDSEILMNSAHLNVFGHIHVYQNYKNKIYYPGSFTRFAHGEELEKGWLKINFDIDTKEYSVERVINEKAPEYKTIKFSDIYDDELTIQENLKIIKKQMKNNTNLRLFIDKELDEKSNSDLSIIKENLVSEGNFKVKIPNKNRIKNTEIEEDLEIIERIEKSNLSTAEIICQFILNKKKGIIITLEDVSKAISFENKQKTKRLIKVRNTEE
jgi:DNA repair exonuclease SbcCD nuclease subunit